MSQEKQPNDKFEAVLKTVGLNIKKINHQNGGTRLIKSRQDKISSQKITELFGVRAHKVFYRLKKLNKENMYA